MNFNEQFHKLIKYNKNLSTIKDFYKKYKNNIDIHYDNNWAFRCACRYGNLKLCQWLYSLDTSQSFNIHFHSDWAFRNACRSGNLKLCKWLYSGYIPGSFDIHYNNDDSFMNCKNITNKFWILSLDKPENFNNNNEFKIYYPVYLKYKQNKKETFVNLKKNRVFNRFTLGCLKKYLI